MAKTYCHKPLFTLPRAQIFLHFFSSYCLSTYYVIFTANQSRLRYATSRIIAKPCFQNTSDAETLDCSKNCFTSIYCMENCTLEFKIFRCEFEVKVFPSSLEYKWALFELTQLDSIWVELTINDLKYISIFSNLMCEMI